MTFFLVAAAVCFTWDYAKRRPRPLTSAGLAFLTLGILIATHR